MIVLKNDAFHNQKSIVLNIIKKEKKFTLQTSRANRPISSWNE